MGTENKQKFHEAFCTECKKVTEQLDNTSSLTCQNCGASNSLLNSNGRPHPRFPSPTTERLRTKEEILKSHIDGGSYSDGENLILVSEALAAMEEFAFQFKEEINRLTISNMAHEYNEAEAARYGEPPFTPPSEEEMQKAARESRYALSTNNNAAAQKANIVLRLQQRAFVDGIKWLIEKQSAK